MLKPLFKLYGNDAVLLSMCFSFHPPVLFCFPFSAQSQLFRLISHLFTPHSLTTIFLVCYLMCGAQNGLGWLTGGGVGGGGSYGWHVDFLCLACKIMSVRDLMCQPRARCRVPVRLPVPQVTGEPRSADHTWVQYRNRNYNLTIYPTLHVRNWFIHFRCHDLNQLREYNQGLPP